MKYYFLPLLLCMSLLFGCGATNTNSTGNNGKVQVATNPGGGANAFNPYMQKKLPNTRQSTAEGEQMLGALGATPQSIEKEAAHRPNWKAEIYPVVFGEKTAPGEIIAILNFSNPESEKVWSQVVQASKSLSPNQCKIVVFGHSKENYGTDLMGLAIWLTHSRPGQAMPYLSYALKRWNEVKAAQKSTGNLKKFTNEYDATASAKDFPIHYGYLMKLNPPIPQSQEMAVAKYCYDAGNVNMYQANQICQYYGVSSIPAVIVNGRVLSKITVDSILGALK